MSLRPNTQDIKMRLATKGYCQLDDYALSYWRDFKNQIQNILNMNNSGFEFEELNGNAYNVDLHKHGDILYNGLRDVVKEHLDTVRVDVLDALNFSKILNQVLKNYKAKISIINNILMYFDRVYAKQKNMKGRYSLGLNLFKDTNVVECISIFVCRYFLSDLNRYIDQLSSTYNINGLGFKLSRDEVQVYYNNPMFLSEELPKIIKNDCALIFVNECIFLNPNRMLINLNNGFYSFYEPYIKQQNSRQLKPTYQEERYVVQWQNRLNNCITENAFSNIQPLLNLSSFIHNIENSGHEIIKNPIKSLVYLKPIPVENLSHFINVVKQNMIYLKTDQENNPVLDIDLEKYKRNGLFKLIHKEFSMLRLFTNNIESFEVEKKYIDNLQITFGLQLRSKKVFTEQLQAFIIKTQDHFIRKDSGMNSVPQLFVENLLQVHKQHFTFIKVFNYDKSLIDNFKVAFAAIINHRSNSKLACHSPELLARYCDELLKKKVKGNSESEIDDKLSDCIIIFKYIDDKDVFQDFYAKMLAKRLIHLQFVSLDSEEVMINKLTKECGYAFTSKLHNMLTDIKVSDDLNNDFTAYLRENPLNLGINFNIHVLNTFVWPLPQSHVSQFTIPQPLVKSISAIEGFYASKFNGRNLTFLYPLCTSELEFRLNQKTYTLVVNTYHMAVLLLLESYDSLRYSQIQENTKLNDKQLESHLQSLVDANILLVNGITELGSDEESKHKRLKPCPQSSIYSLNKNYSNKRSKVKIIVKAKRETKTERKGTRFKVDEHLKH